MIEVRFHGRGGQGAVTSAELVALAAIEEGKFAQSFPSFGPERRGAPVVAFARVDEKPIRLRSKVYQPDVAVVLDPSLLKILDPSQGLKPDGILIINSNKTLEQVRSEFGFKTKLAVVDADLIAREELGLLITNTTMIGALVKGTGIVQLESLTPPLRNRFGRGAERNLKALRRAFSETLLNHYSKGRRSSGELFSGSPGRREGGAFIANLCFEGEQTCQNPSINSPGGIFPSAAW